MGDHLAVGASGNIFGTTSEGGDSHASAGVLGVSPGGCGVVFEVTRS
jgi:hypothetical protein